MALEPPCICREWARYRGDVRVGLWTKTIREPGCPRHDPCGVRNDEAVQPDWFAAEERAGR